VYVLLTTTVCTVGTVCRHVYCVLFSTYLYIYAMNHVSIKCGAETCAVVLYMYE
jgi:hypothetical protein